MSVSVSSSCHGGGHVLCCKCMLESMTELFVCFSPGEETIAFIPGDSTLLALQRAAFAGREEREGITLQMTGEEKGRRREIPPSMNRQISGI